MGKMNTTSRMAKGFGKRGGASPHERKLAKAFQDGARRATPPVTASQIIAQRPRLYDEAAPEPEPFWLENLPDPTEEGEP